MKTHRWIMTELLPDLGMRVTYKLGTTDKNASLSLTYARGDCIVGTPIFVSPNLARPIRDVLLLNRHDKPEEVNAAIWAALWSLFKKGRDLTKEAS